MSDAPVTIMHDGTMYVRMDVATQRARNLEAERDELIKLLYTYRQAVFEVKDRLGKLDKDQESWLNE